MTAADENDYIIPSLEALYKQKQKQTKNYFLGHLTNEPQQQKQ